MTVIALDAMGGDFAPRETVLGAAAVAGPSLQILLTGDSGQIDKHLAEVEKDVREYLRIVEAPEVIGFDEEPTKAVRTKVNSSMVVACREVAEGRADGVVSAGNTGAMLAASMLGLKRIKGFKRPGLCAVLPIPDKPTVFIDVGANSEVRPIFLLEFANMASIFAQEVMEIQNPTVGLISIGEEAIKGNDLVLETHKLMAESPYLNFYGNIEGRDIPAGLVDIVVTDGFTGNVCLKLMESTSSMIFHEVKKVATSSITTRIGGLLMRRRLNSFKKSVDPEEFGGAYLLGVRGLVVVCHGNSSRKAIASALRYANRASDHGLVGLLEKRITAMRESNEGSAVSQ